MLSEDCRQLKRLTLLCDCQWVVQIEAKSQSVAAASQMVEAQRADLAAQQVQLAENTSQLALQARSAIS